MTGDDPWDTLLEVAKSSVHLLPYFAIWLIGATVAVVRWRRHPRVSLLALCAFGLFALESLLGLAAHYWLLRSIKSTGMGTIQDEVNFYLMIFRVIHVAIYATAWVLLLMALFGGRNTPRPVYVVESDEMQDRPMSGDRNRAVS
jgi:hypothetical protein